MEYERRLEYEVYARTQYDSGGLLSHTTARHARERYAASDFKHVDDDLSILCVATRVVTMDWALVRDHAMPREASRLQHIARCKTAWPI